MKERSDQSSLSGEPIEELKSIVSSHIQSSEGYSKIKEQFAREFGSREPTSEEVKEFIRKQNITPEIAKGLKGAPSKRVSEIAEDIEEQAELREEKIPITVRVVDGRDFIDYVDLSEDLSFQCSLSLFGERKLGKPVRASLSPQFNDEFTFYLRSKEGIVVLTKFIQMNSPINLVLLSINHKTQKKEVISTINVDWRHALYGKTVEPEVKMSKIDQQSKGALGIIRLQIDLPAEVPKKSLTSEEIVMHQLDYEKKLEDENKKGFDSYAKEWWNDFKQIRESHKKRLVKIYAETEDREKYAFRPVFSLVTPFQPSRLVETPYHAARFVSLIPFERTENPGGSKQEIWHTFHSFLARGSGDCEDHSLLLCSLLLGFGLDAYVAVGTAADDPHVWVLTRVQRANSPLKTIVFWESVTGQRLEVDDPRVPKFYKTINCVFTCGKLYANIQADDRVINTDFDFENETHWKSMLQSETQKVLPYNFPVSLSPSTLNPTAKAEEIEKALKEKLSNYRMSALLASTLFDDSLGYMLSPAVCNYELERLCGLTFGNDEFKAAITQVVPDGHTFKAFPVQVQGFDIEKIMKTIIQSKIGKDILDTKGDSIRYAIRARVSVYPEDTSAVWVIIAVRFRSIS